MTPLEIIEQRMVELWGGRNVARLARESGIARETVSKILGGKRGIGDELARRLARALSLEVADLLPPRAEPANLATVLRRLEAIQAEVDRVTTVLERLVDRMAAIEARLVDRDAPGRSAES